MMRAAVALLAGVAMAVLVAVAEGCLLGNLGPLSARVALLAGVGGLALAWRALDKLPPLPRPRGWVAWGVVGIYALFTLRAFGWLAFTNGDELLVLSPNNLGDFSIHLTYVRYLANGAAFWPQNAIFASEPLFYPLGADLFNALLLLCGVEVLRGFIWVGLLGAAATGVALWRWGQAFVVAGFLFNGGLAFALLFAGNPTEVLQESVAWKSLPLALLVTQRGLLYALPVGLFLLWSWRKRFLERRPGLPLWLECLFYSTLPLFHLHTFLFLSLVLATWFLLSWTPLAPREARGRLLTLVGCSFLPATVCVALQSGGFRAGGGFLRWLPGWMQEPEAPFWFWLRNFGFFPLLIVMALFWLAGQGTPIARRWLAVASPGLLCFAATLLWAFAPWEWDNTKLMLWGYLLLLPPLWALLRRWPPVARAVACVLLFASGFLSLVEGMQGTGYSIARRSELDGMEASLRGLPQPAVFACQPAYNHPLLLLGYPVVAGYEGHLLSHGIAYHPRWHALHAGLRGEAHTLAPTGATHLFWGRPEREAWGEPPEWVRPLPKVATGPWGTIYLLQPRAEL